MDTNYLGGWGSAYDMSTADLNNDGALDIVSASPGDSTISILFGNSNDGVSALQSFSLRTRSDARSAMNYLGGALNRVSQQRGQIGAFQSRVSIAISTLQTSAQNYREATSRITDADVAEESAHLTSNQILQQAAASVLAQANLQPDLVLRLLKDV